MYSIYEKYKMSKELTKEEHADKFTKMAWKRYWKLFPKQERMKLMAEFKKEEQNNKYGAITKSKYNVTKTPFKKENDFITQLIPRHDFKKMHIKVKQDMQRISNEVAE